MLSARIIISSSSSGCIDDSRRRRTDELLHTTEFDLQFFSQGDLTNGDEKGVAELEVPAELHAVGRTRSAFLVLQWTTRECMFQAL